MNVRLRLERIEQDLQKVAEHVAHHEGVPYGKAVPLDNSCSNIILLAAAIAAACRKQMHDASASALEKRVRRALGYTTP